MPCLPNCLPNCLPVNLPTLLPTLLPCLPAYLSLQHKVPDKLTDPTSVTQIHAITKHIGMLVNGMHGEPPGPAQLSSGGCLPGWSWVLQPGAVVWSPTLCSSSTTHQTFAQPLSHLFPHPPTHPPTHNTPPPLPLPLTPFLPAGDARSLVQKSRAEAAEFRFKYGYEMPVHYLSRVLADQAQVYTQVRARSLVRSH